MNTSQKAGLGGILVIILILVGIFFIKPALTPTTAPTTSDTTPSPTDGTSAWTTYRNELYGYTISYPQKLGVQPFPDVPQSGANFGDNTITVDVSPKIGTPPYPSIDEYVKTAATQEIQSFEKLNSLKTITTDSGLTGYETTWIVAPPPMLNPPPNREPSVSSPITYFAVPGNDAVVLKVWFNVSTPSQEDIDIYNQMIKSVSFEK